MGNAEFAKANGGLIWSLSHFRKADIFLFSTADEAKALAANYQ
jgi:hypothetical protein